MNITMGGKQTNLDIYVDDVQNRSRTDAWMQCHVETLAFLSQGSMTAYTVVDNHCSKSVTPAPPSIPQPFPDTNCTRPTFDGTFQVDGQNCAAYSMQCWTGPSESNVTIFFNGSTPVRILVQQGHNIVMQIDYVNFDIGVPNSTVFVIPNVCRSNMGNKLLRRSQVDQLAKATNIKRQTLALHWLIRQSMSR